MNRFFLNLIAFTILIFFSLDCKKQSLSSFEENDNFGFKNQDGEVIIAPQYSFVYDFNEKGVTHVFGKDGWSCIDTKNRILLIPFQYDNGPDPFVEGLARFTENKKIGFYEPGCKKVIEAEYDFAFPFEDDFSVVCLGCFSVSMGEHSTIEGGHYGLIDRKGKVVIPTEYDSISVDLSKKTARVIKDKMAKDIPIF
ncbi:WG repeat-containing protein [Leptospira adleri]|uniref:WG repeat-containing protein n=1 Tax=Leptospira adleri TaxID=2023186 RepID=A0A2M9YP49_9LEPT|nr:WG repeat-containing protein [Leptospira adleri]PJZ53302.1 hypothetical protein CH380_10880 [Leptospira adleri]PJZ63890.1 hypothetical protein CH376_00230 [Leptospira adleri]